MKSVIELPGLGDIKTTVSTHTRSVPRQKGSTYLEILALGMEKLRLDTEKVWISRREARIEKRLQEIKEKMGVLLEESRQELTPAMPSGGDKMPVNHGHGSRGWRNMPISY